MLGHQNLGGRPRSVNSSFDSRRTGGSSLQSSIDHSGYLSDTYNNNQPRMVNGGNAYYAQRHMRYVQ